MEISRYINGKEVDKKELKNVIYKSSEITSAVHEARRRIASISVGKKNDERKNTVSG